MSSLDEGIKRDEPYIHSGESNSNPLRFMLFAGMITCSEESIRSIGYIMLLGGLLPTAYDTVARIYRGIRR